jgi:hypothetical protein
MKRTPDTADDRPSHGGRPKAVEPGTSLTTWVPVSEYARLCRLATMRGETLSATVRAILKLRRHQPP